LLFYEQDGWLSILNFDTRTENSRRWFDINAVACLIAGLWVSASGIRIGGMFLSSGRPMKLLFEGKYNFGIVGTMRDSEGGYSVPR
jgi:hypothetical protein